MPFAIAWELFGHGSSLEAADPRNGSAGAAGQIEIVEFSSNGENKGTALVSKVVKSDDQWRKLLTPEQYDVTRRKGTEAPYTNMYDENHQTGALPLRLLRDRAILFGYQIRVGHRLAQLLQPIAKENVRTPVDRSLCMDRTEVLCARCDAHLGHVFDDGPAPTGLRYCMNSRGARFHPRRAGVASSPDQPAGTRWQTGSTDLSPPLSVWNERTWPFARVAEY